MPTVSEQTSAINAYINQGQYADAYLYIASQIRDDPSYDPQLANWFEDAAKINGAEPNFLKDYVFAFNAEIAGLQLR